MTSPLTAGQTLAVEHAKKAAELAAECEDDRFLPPGMVSVVRSYRALAHALLASWALSIPDAAVNPAQPDPVGVPVSVNPTG